MDDEREAAPPLRTPPPGRVRAAGTDQVDGPSGRLRDRTVWTIADQVVNSCQSLGIGLVIAREAGLEGVGAFAIAFAIYQVVMAATRPMHSDPLAVGFSAAGRAARQEAIGMAGGAAMVLGLAVGGALALVSIPAPGQTGAVLLAFAVAVPALCLQDVWRSSFFAAGNPRGALANDLLVLLALAVGTAIAVDVRPHSAAALTLAWGAAAGVGAVVGAGQAHVLPRPARSARWWRSTFPLASRMLGENAAANVAYAAALGSVAAFSGLTDLGRLRTVQVAVGLMSPVLVAVTTVVVAEGTRALRSDDHRFSLLVTGTTAAATGATVAVTAAWALLPIDWVRALIGDNWAASRELVIPWGFYVSCSAISLGTAAGLRALRRPGRAFRARLWGALLGTTSAVIGAAVGGPLWAVLGFASGELLCAALSTRELRRVWAAWRGTPWDVGAIQLGGGQIA